MAVKESRDPNGEEMMRSRGVSTVTFVVAYPFRYPSLPFTLTSVVLFMPQNFGHIVLQFLL